MAHQRTILYYPSISIPAGSWLRQALLYFDEVASIVPSEVSWDGEIGNALVLLTPDIEYLQHEGAFRRISPERLVLPRDGWERARKLSDEFAEAVKSDRFKKLLGANEKYRKYVEIHKGKLPGSNVLFSDISEYLLKNSLLKFDEQHSENVGDWMIMEEKPLSFTRVSLLKN